MRKQRLREVQTSANNKRARKKQQLHSHSILKGKTILDLRYMCKEHVWKENMECSCEEKRLWLRVRIQTLASETSCISLSRRLVKPESWNSAQRAAKSWFQWTKKKQPTVQEARTVCSEHPAHGPRRPDPQAASQDTTTDVSNCPGASGDLRFIALEAKVTG